MISIRKIDITNRHDARRFVQFPNQLYRDCPQWVPYPAADGLAQLNRQNAYFMHSDADFFVAEEDGQTLQSASSVPPKYLSKIYTKKFLMKAGKCLSVESAALQIVSDGLILFLAHSC